MTQRKSKRSTMISLHIRENGRHPLGALLDRDDPDLKIYRAEQVRRTKIFQQTRGKIVEFEGSLVDYANDEDES